MDKLSIFWLGMVKKHLFALAILLGLGLFAMKIFLGPDYFDGHDAQAHLVRLYQYDLALRDGQILPQWAGGLLAGRGYPVFIFAYPLPYLIAEGFHLVGFTLAVAIKLTFVLSYLVSVIGMYFFATTYWGSKNAGFLTALLWSWAPPIFEKIFIGGALGEVVAFAFIPWTFLALFKLFKQPNLKNSFYLALSLTLWSLSHLLNPIIFSPLLVIFFFFQLSQAENKNLSLKFLFLSGFMTLGLIAWFIMPAILEIKFTHFNEFVINQYSSQFVSLKRLLYSRWGTDAPGWGNNPVSQQVGVAQWLAIGLTAGLAILKPTRTVLEGKVYPFLLSFIISIFLMLSISQPVWDLPTPLQNVSTPWRFLSLAVFSAAMAGGYVITRIKKIKLEFLIIILLSGLTIYGNRNHLRINDIRNYDLNFLQNYTGVATGWNEHLPIWVKDTPHEFPTVKLEVLTGGCQIQPKTMKSNLQEFSVNCQQGSFLQLNTAYYPGWQIIIDNQNINPEIKSNLDQSNGMMQLTLGPGDYNIIARFVDTPLRRTSKVISLLTLMILGAYYGLITIH